MGGDLDPAVAVVRTAVRKSLADLSPGDQLLLACSGGADSMALASAVLFEAPKHAWQVSAALVDHRLQSESEQVANRVAGWLRDHGADDVQVLPVTVTGDGGPEAAARRARYEALFSHAARRNALLLLGHTLDDQAETVLLGLARGSGIRSLAGMPAATDRLRRPLLGVPRATTQASCTAQGLPVWEDPHNRDPKYLRSRVRHAVLPMLEEQLGPGVAAALARTARLTALDADTLDGIAVEELSAAQVATGDPVRTALGVEALLGLRPAIRHRVLRAAGVAAGAPAGELFAVHVEAVDALVTGWHGQQGVDLPGKVVARREGAVLILEQSV